MRLEAFSVSSFEFLSEPTLVVRRSGVVLGANTAGRRLLVNDPIGMSLHEAVLDSREEIEAVLRRASASTSPTVGALTLQTVNGPTKFRVHAARLGCETNETMLVLRMLAVDDDQFALLNRRVRELDRQLRQRLQEKAALEEALRLNRTLLDELQHRVKNNIQMMMTLIRISAEGRTGPGIADVVATARLRLQAMASTQEAVYQSTKLGAVRSGVFLRDLVASIGESAGFADALEVDIADLDLGSDQAHCLALIINELVTNAGKHALRNGRGKIRVVLAADEDVLELTVEDDGPGMPEGAGGRFSGLHLVRSLCRQIGASLDIASGAGTRCQIRLGRAKEEKT